MAEDIIKSTIATREDDKTKQDTKGRRTKEKEELYQSSNNKIGKG